MWIIPLTTISLLYFLYAHFPCKCSNTSYVKFSPVPHRLMIISYLVLRPQDIRESRQIRRVDNGSCWRRYESHLSVTLCFHQKTSITILWTLPFPSTVTNALVPYFRRNDTHFQDRIHLSLRSWSWDEKLSEEIRFARNGISLRLDTQMRTDLYHCQRIELWGNHINH